MFIRDFKIGADIEVFLQDRNSGEIVTAEGIIKGTKDEPFLFDVENSRHFATSLDNVMAEFCIPPSNTPGQFHAAIERALRYIESHIPNNLRPLPQPAAYLSNIYLQTENAKKFGCDPDFNVWTRLENAPPGTSTNMRTCGGHIHIGYSDPAHFINHNLIKAMDIFVGVPSILQEPDNDRKTMYGKAGAYRDKPYGVEYRTVSNYYLQSKQLTEWVFNNTIEAINFVNMNRCNFLGDAEKEEIVNCINYNNKDLAKRIIEKYGVKLAA